MVSSGSSPLVTVASPRWFLNSNLSKQRFSYEDADDKSDNNRKCQCEDDSSTCPAATIADRETNDERDCEQTGNKVLAPPIPGPSYQLHSETS